MNVLVVGGGNIGTALACHIKQSHPHHHVRLLVRNSGRFADSIVLKDVEKQTTGSVVLDVISSHPEEAADRAEIAFVCLPHFAVERAFRNIEPHVEDGCFVGVIPGSGGCEFYFDEIFHGRARLFGFQRVPFVARLEKYGHIAQILSWKPCSVLGTLRKSDLESACASVEACGLTLERADNYLAISLAPSNPVIHTACVYGLFNGHSRHELYPRVKRLYEEWGDAESSIMIAMDEELHALFDCIHELDMSSVRSLTEHYESPDASSLTRKILSIPSFRELLSPMKLVDGGAVVDLSSRMFTEDFPYGLAIIRGFGDIYKIEMPVIDRILGWYSAWTDAGYYKEGAFAGEGLVHTGIPQNYGIVNPNQVVELYAK